MCNASPSTLLFLVFDYECDDEGQGRSHFFENFAAQFPEKEIGQRRLGHKTGLCRFWRWSSRESAWPISKLILAMGGTLGPAPKAMQLSQPSLLSYLQCFNKKRRLNYKIDLLPRLSSETANPRIKEPVKIPSRTAREGFGVDGKGASDEHVRPAVAG
jgi:hypothetical protein